MNAEIEMPGTTPRTAFMSMPRYPRSRNPRKHAMLGVEQREIRGLLDRLVTLTRNEELEVDRILMVIPLVESRISMLVQDSAQGPNMADLASTSNKCAFTRYPRTPLPTSL